MGSPKALLDAGGHTAVEAVLAAARRAGLGRLRVVLGRDGEETVAGADLAGAEAVVNPAPERGRTSSIQEGLRALGDCDCVILWPVDLPWVEAATAAKVAGACRTGVVAVPEHAGRRGHPIAIPADLLQGVMALGPDEPLNRWVRRQEVLLVPVEDAACVTPMNTPAEYAAAFARFASGS